MCIVTQGKRQGHVNSTLEGNKKQELAMKELEPCGRSKMATKVQTSGIPIYRKVYILYTFLFYPLKLPFLPVCIYPFVFTYL